jgi:dienelactone hydrolase
LKRFAVAASLLLIAVSAGGGRHGGLENGVATGPRLVVTPRMALIDAPVNVRVAMKSPHSLATIEARAEIDGTSYRSWALYRADAAGEVDLATAVPLAGTYADADRMGLFWSMQPLGSYRYVPASLRPIHVRLTLYTADGSTSVIVARLRIAADVARVPFRGDPIVGALFVAPRTTARAIVVVLGGSEGGMDENRAAIIASHGYDALALAYFGINGLPKDLANIPLEYVDRAIKLVHDRPGLNHLPIVLEGDSKGAELALLAAARNPLIKGVVAFAPSSSVFEGFSTKEGTRRASWTISGAPLPFADNPIAPAVKAQIRGDRAAKRPVSFRNQYMALATPPQPASTIAVEKIAAPIMLVAGADDQLWPSDVFARRIVTARRENHMQFSDEVLVLPSAGHAIDVPYMPTNGLAVIDEGGFRLALGGTAPGYAHADAITWPLVLDFLKRISDAATPEPRATLSAGCIEGFESLISRCTGD